MRVNFRQGVVKAPVGFITVAGGDVDMVISPGELVIVTFADRDSDYLFVEKETVPNAWPGPFAAENTYWLYWDIDSKTGAVTRGQTLLAPVAGANAPATPANDQHWFDTATHTHKVWNTAAGAWKRVVRTFAGSLTGGAVLNSVSADTPLFTGTQIGSATAISPGFILFDTDGDPIKRQNGTFFTTETPTRTSSMANTSIKLAALLVTGEAQSPTTAYSVVSFSAFDQFVPATTYNISQGLYGIVEQACTTGEEVAVVTQGVVQNPGWDWSALSVGAPLYVTGSGALTSVQDGDVPAVASVVNATTILFRNAVSNVVQAPVALTGAGTPEAAVTAAVGTLYLRTDGGASTTLYVKETGAGNTGWVAK